jgi:threonine/homoserine/homoserine lactone efflux protein
LSGFFGIAILFKTAPWLYLTLKLLGGTYLIFLGLKLIISSTNTGSNHSALSLTNFGPIQGYK